MEHVISQSTLQHEDDLQAGEVSLKGGTSIEQRLPSENAKLSLSKGISGSGLGITRMPLFKKKSEK